MGTMLDKARYSNSLSSKLTAHLQRICLLYTSISSEEAGMSTNEKDKNETFKPSDYTLEAKKDVYKRQHHT